MPDETPQATVLITTRNRREELATALDSALAQTGAIEILVIDDGSTDGTADMVREKYPRVRLHRSEVSSGYILQRNCGAELASGRVIVSIDDDAVFSTPQVVAQTLAEFDHPRIGAVAIPFVNAGAEDNILQHAPNREQVWITDRYIGTAHAVRRDVFLQCGGYHGFFVHQGEEGDFCLRMLNAGYVVRLGSADLIHHHESPRRNFDRMDFYGRRNDILFATLNVPMPWLVPHLLATTVNGVRWAFRIGRYRQIARGLFHGYVDAVRFRKERRPVSAGTYQLSRRLKRQGAAKLSEVEPLLPPPESLSSLPANHRLNEALH